MDGWIRNGTEGRAEDGVYEKYMKGYEGLQSYGEVHKNMERYQLVQSLLMGINWCKVNRGVQKGTERY